MEERQVSGRTVLVPVVYLAGVYAQLGDGQRDDRRTRREDRRRRLSTNEGGTIQAERSLTVNTTGDIVNRSGTISGGTVDLKTQGNVVNETVATQRGDSASGSTDIGKTATIVAKDGLSIDAAKDVTIKGGDVKAGGSARAHGRRQRHDRLDSGPESPRAPLTHDGRTTTR